MADQYERPIPTGAQNPFFSAESSDGDRHFNSLLTRIEQIAVAHSLLGYSLEMDGQLGGSKIMTKSFVSRSGGTESYPFPHLRIKLRPKSGVDSLIKVAAVRFPTEGIGPISNDFVAERLFIGWATADGTETAFVLDGDAFSRLSIETAFEQPDDTGRWPSIDARTSTDEMEQFTLTTVLRDFEPDLQTLDADLQA